MKKLSCRDAGMPNCSWEATAQNDDDLIQKARQHAQNAHQRTLTPAEESRVRSVIKNA
jgi:predicted small metal-binding protein